MFLKLVLFILIYIFQFSYQYDPKKSHVIFKKLSTVEIYENLPIGSNIIDLKSQIINSNLIEKSHFTFELIDEPKNKHLGILNIHSLNNYFILDELTGIIKTSKSIDLEYFCDYNLCQNKHYGSKDGCLIHFRLRATRNDPEPLILNISFDLIIHDINEFYPEFAQKSPLYFNVNEEFSPIKLAIGIVPVDNDCTDRSNINFYIEITDILVSSSNQDTNKNLEQFNFQIIVEQDLIFLYTDKSLDRELYQSIELDIIAHDRLNLTNSNKSFLKVILNITDINDNSPKFERQEYILEFDENLSPGTELLRLNAIDLDQGQNGLVKYEFKTQNEDIKETFQLDSKTGVLSLKKKLNSNKKNWNFQIKASDSGFNSKSSICLVKIMVNDVNNHEPVINLNLFVITGLIEPKFLTTKNWNLNTVVKEDLIFLPKFIPINTTIGIVNVIDRDSGLNGQIDSCEIISNEEAPIYLQSFDDINPNSEIYSSDLDLNEDIKSLIYPELKNFNKKFKNEKKFFIRTGKNFNKFHNYNLEIKCSDRGSLMRQISLKKLRLIILNANKIVNQYLDEDELDENFIFVEEEFDDYDQDFYQSMSNRLILKIDLNENNPMPIDLIKIKPSDFDLNTQVKYEFIMPVSNKLNSTLNKAKIAKCSMGLMKFLSVNESTGIIGLNKSLDREECSKFKFLIKATNLYEHRISSFLTFKINVLDMDDNAPKFEQNYYVFDIIENTNKTFKIKINDPDLKPDYIFKLESLNDEHNIPDLKDYFQIEKTYDPKSINLILSKNLEYSRRNKYLFNLIVLEIDKNDPGIVHSDSTLIEIIVLNEKELRPCVKKLIILGDLATKNFSLSKKLNNENFFFQTNLDHLIDKLKITEPFKGMAFLNVLKIDVAKTKNDLIHFYIHTLEFYDSVPNFKNKSKFVFPSEMDSTQLFLLDESTGVLNIDLTSFNNLHPKLITPFICVLGIRVKNLTNELTSNFSVILSLNLEKTSQIEFLKLENYLNDIYSIYHKTLFTTIKANLSEKYFLKENFKTIRSALVNSHLPLLILTIVIIFLLVILMVLFIISILYSITFCNFFNCRDKTDGLRVNDTCQTNLLSRALINDPKSHGWLRFKISKLFNQENKTRVNVCPNVCLNPIENNKNNSKFVQKNDQNDYLLDSPILVRKIFESDNEEAKEKYLKKYHLEYLFDNSPVKKNEIIQNEKKKSKKVLLKCSETKYGNKFENISCSENEDENDDDDFIIPMGKSNKKTVCFKNQEMFNSTIYNNQFRLNSSSYMKSPIQPDDSVWIKKLNSNQMSCSGLNNNEIVL
ncbi:unnamed protein product [Brachionus calyciflorus]|uniref:Cadherin domain-containing protein n=1 Tax=Brachionus calyciflorus TaxID=104777 RepID=A0A813U734_9BILA|nr:unnamed protein product [Brachionus calyciflorus]